MFEMLLMFCNCREVHNKYSFKECKKFYGLLKELTSGPKLFIRKERVLIKKTFTKGGIHTKLPRESHLVVCWRVDFIARCLIRGNLTLFEITNKSFVLYAFIKKN